MSTTEPFGHLAPGTWYPAPGERSEPFRGISFPEGRYFGDAPAAMLPGGATIELLGLDALHGVASITVVWDDATT